MARPDRQSLNCWNRICWGGSDKSHKALWSLLCTPQLCMFASARYGPFLDTQERPAWLTSSVLIERSLVVGHTAFEQRPATLLCTTWQALSSTHTHTLETSKEICKWKVIQCRTFQCHRRTLHSCCLSTFIDHEKAYNFIMVNKAGDPNPKELTNAHPDTSSPFQSSR